jgi:hypothetical protein
MFIRQTKTSNAAAGEAYFTFRLVASERIGGKVRQQTLLNHRYFQTAGWTDPACSQDNGCRAKTTEALRSPESDSRSGGRTEIDKLMAKIHECSATTKNLKT